MRVLYIEPFDAGSHAMFGRVLPRWLGSDVEWTALTLPGRHWKWRMRGAASYLAHVHADVLRDAGSRYDVVLASSYLALAELRGLVPGLSAVPAVLYFHENQFAYPQRAAAATPGRAAAAAAQDQDYGFAQMVSALSAERVVFNSEHNRETFLAGASALLARLPDAKVPGWVEGLRAKSEVLGLPLELAEVSASELVEGEVSGEVRALGPVIVWNHRWEHDKRPELFFAALRVLMSRGVAFRVAVCGERYREAPAVFEHAREWLGERVLHWGYAASRAAYEGVLRGGHLAVSTSAHEFFGVSMLEATHLGCHPLVPDGLSYRELFPLEYRYDSQSELHARLCELCSGWVSGAVQLRGDRRSLTRSHGAGVRVASWRDLLAAVVAGGAGGRGALR